MIKHPQHLDFVEKLCVLLFCPIGFTCSNWFNNVFCKIQEQLSSFTRTIRPILNYVDVLLSPNCIFPSGNKIQDKHGKEHFIGRNFLFFVFQKKKCHQTRFDRSDPTFQISLFDLKSGKIEKSVLIVCTFQIPARKKH